MKMKIKAKSKCYFTVEFLVIASFKHAAKLIFCG